MPEHTRVIIELQGLVEHAFGFQRAILGPMNRRQFKVQVDLHRPLTNPLLQLLTPIRASAVLRRQLLGWAGWGRCRMCGITTAQQAIALVGGYWHGRDFRKSPQSWAASGNGFACIIQFSMAGSEFRSMQPHSFYWRRR